MLISFVPIIIWIVTLSTCLSDAKSSSVLVQFFVVIVINLPKE